MGVSGPIYGPHSCWCGYCWVRQYQTESATWHQQFQTYPSNLKIKHDPGPTYFPIPNNDDQVGVKIWALFHETSYQWQIPEIKSADSQSQAKISVACINNFFF